MHSKKHIVYLGSSGFPYGLAEIQKMILISKSLLIADNTVTIICNRGVLHKSDYPELKAASNFEGIDFIYTSGNQFRPDNFIKRNLLKVKGMVREYVLLRKLRKNKKLDYAILSTHKFYSVLYYVFLSKLFRFKTILNYVEYYSGVKKKWFQISKWANDWLYDRYAPGMADAIFPISEFLINHIEKVAPGKRYLKIPILTDMERFNDCETSVEGKEKYFLFCGAAAYIEIVKFIIDSFIQLNNNPVYLYLVINGNKEQIQKINEYIGYTQQKDKIKIISDLTEKELNKYYKNAMALLIPLRPTLQDTARFPHKIGEYLASGNPVISTNFGEVKYYFKDMQDMLIVEDYSTRLFANKMKYVIDNKEEVKKIGTNGKNRAAKIFDYRNYAGPISSFINVLAAGLNEHSGF